MIRRLFHSIALGAACIGAAAASSMGQCPSIDFENLAVGTAVTTQYAGVTFSLVGTGCSPGTVFCRIITPGGGTSSGTKALGRDQGCPDFYYGDFRMVFDEPHNNVHFRLGEWGTGTYNVRAYSTTSGTTGLLISRTIGLSGDALTAVYYPVELSATGIRRVEIEQSIGAQAVIDDLEFDLDDSPPVASFSNPPEASPFCYGGPIYGTANDPDGVMASFRLDRRAFGASTWTLITISSTPVVDDLLSNWYPASSATEGYYVLRLTVTNVCGLQTVAERVVYLDRGFDSLSIRSPGASDIIGGTVCIDGTAWDHCPPATDVHELAYAPLPIGGPYTVIDPGNPVNDVTVITDPLGTWNTTSPLVPDGNYRIRLTGVTVCDLSDAVTTDVIVDNTPPVAFIASPHACDYTNGMVVVLGTVTDAHLGGWSLYYTGGDHSDWVRISAGIGPIVNGVLGTWDTRGLRNCAYTLRLIATDRANVDCGARHNQTEYTISVNVGCDADFNRDGILNSQDFFDFLTSFFTGC